MLVAVLTSFPNPCTLLGVVADVRGEVEIWRLSICTRCDGPGLLSLPVRDLLDMVEYLDGCWEYTTAAAVTASD